MSTKDYQFWIHANGGADKVQLPVNPESISVKYSSDNTTYNIDSITQCKINMYCVLESFDYSEVGGDPGTYSYSVTFKEYRAVQMKKVSVNKTTKKATVSKPGTARVSNKTAPKTHTVKSGDCLWNIAKKYYGNGSDFTKIYNANKKVIGSNPNRIYAGQVLTIP